MRVINLEKAVEGLGRMLGEWRETENKGMEFLQEYSSFKRWSYKGISEKRN